MCQGFQIMYYNINNAFNDTAFNSVNDCIA